MTDCSKGNYGQNCSKECSHNCENDYCNPQNGSCVHGCKPGYDYTMNTNCSDAIVDDHSEQNGFSYGAVAGSVIAALCVVAAIVVIHNLWDYIRDNKQNECQHFNDEFAKLPTGLVHKHDVAGREENKGKNRYREMHAYDHSRVTLQKEKSDDCDYINASYIDGYDKARKFIASQGPTKNMIDDFWRMVWQENAEKIVMLTNLIEMATVKCLKYWPEMDQTCSFGGVDISLAAVKTFRDYEMRTLIVKKGQSKSRRIQQYHFKAWPDKDVPDNGWCLVEFLNAVETKSTNSPIIVHCSAGVGRTGTFVALDNLVDQTKTENCVRPLQMVEALRRQRVNMVQTMDQYIYLHEALAEALLMGTDHIWYRQFESVHSSMMTREPDQKQTRLVQQFLLIEKSLTNESQLVQNGPEYGNMETILSEIDAYRPKLKKRGSEFTQQLGAILLPSFSGKNSFLLCISPCEEELEEFWSLVEEQHVITVIMLTASSCRAHQTSVNMGGNGNGKVGRYSVNFIQERKNKTFNERSFSFRDEDNEDEDYLTTIKQFQITGWADEETLPPMQNMLDCLDAVRKWQPHLAENRPVLIHCETGHKRSGMIAALLNELHRMEKTRGQINIVETVKTMKQRNKDIIPSTVQYKFIYDSLLEHAKNTTDYENI
ncbi:PTPRE-like protein [Mya arenaria]|uniref:protein-tyrosine-phosphatase n=1 Tax=Mya arenaria TaxID=6604 RepID=A0ABY7DPR4_MYAAR|nr:PTPRE-like protein [Mya arenaria]